MRVELPDGQWVEFREELTHGQFKRLSRALLRATEHPAEAGPDIDTEFCAVYVSAWFLRAPDGSNVELPADIDARPAIIDNLPAGIVTIIATAAANAWRMRPDPNAFAAS